MKSYVLALACCAIVAVGCKKTTTPTGGDGGSAGGTGGSGAAGTTTGMSGSTATGSTGGRSGTAGTTATGTGGKSDGGRGGTSATSTGGSGDAGRGGTSAGTGGKSDGGHSGSSAGGSGGSATGGAGGAGGTVSEACKTYCACMPLNCSSSTFPDSKTCEAFCATGSSTAVSCWNTHCNNAATMGKNGVHCTHALGDGTVCPKM